MNIIAALTAEVDAINTLKCAQKRPLFGGRWQVGCRFLVWIPNKGVRLAVIANDRGEEAYPLGDEFVSNEAMLEKLRAYKDELSLPTATRALEGMKRLGIISDLEDLSIALGGEQFKVIDVKVTEGGEASGNAKQLALYKAQRVNGDGIAGPDFVGLTPDGCAVEGDYIPAARVKFTADQLRNMMSFFHVPNRADSWVHSPSAPVDWITTSAPCAGHSMPLSQYKQQIGRIIRIGTFECEDGTQAFKSAALAAEAGHPVHLGKNPGEKWKVTVEPRPVPALMQLTEQDLRESNVGAGKSITIEPRP